MERSLLFSLGMLDSSLDEIGAFEGFWVLSGPHAQHPSVKTGSVDYRGILCVIARQNPLTCILGRKTVARVADSTLRVM